VVAILVLVGVLIVAGVAAGITTLATRPVPDRAVAEPTGEVPVTVEPEAPAPPALRGVLVRTEPEGAQVERDGVFLGDAPVTVRVEEGTLVTLRVSAVGYEPREITLDGSQPEVPVMLRAIPGPKTRPAPAPSERAAPEGEPAPEEKVGPAPERVQNTEQASPFNYCRFNRASVWVRDGDFFQSRGGHMNEACTQALGADAVVADAVVVLLLLLHGDGDLGDIP